MSWDLVIVVAIIVGAIVLLVALARTPRESARPMAVRPRSQGDLQADAATTLITSTTLLLGDHGNWLDRRGGRAAYDELLRTPLPAYQTALARALTGNAWTAHRAFVLAVKLGREGTEECMIQTLWASRGTAQKLCTDMLNSGNQRLSRTAESWAAQNRYVVTFTGALPGATWGVF
ncbi:hypothetical protein [Kribbella endophytica]